MLQCLTEVFPPHVLLSSHFGQEDDVRMMIVGRVSLQLLYSTDQPSVS